MSTLDYTIYLADDDEDDRDFFEEILADINEKIKFKAFENGLNLMQYIQDFPDISPDFIFLDLNMPIMDGQNCLLNIRRLLKFKHVPIIIYSTSIDSSKVDFLRKNGANLYLKKPNSLNNLKSAVLNCFKTINTSRLGVVDKSNFVIQ